MAERTKYYPINLKDKKLHTKFMILERERGYKNVDDALERLITDSNLVGPLQEQNNLFRKELVEANKKLDECEKRQKK